jgi:hypothetical protein
MPAQANRANPLNLNANADGKGNIAYLRRRGLPSPRFRKAKELAYSLRSTGTGSSPVSTRVKSN